MTDLVNQALAATDLLVLVVDRDGTIVQALGADTGAPGVDDATPTGDRAHATGATGATGPTLASRLAGIDHSTIDEVATGRREATWTWARLSGATGESAALPVRLVPLGDGRHLVATVFREGARPSAKVSDRAADLVRAASTEGIWDWCLRTGTVWWSAEMSAMLGHPSVASVASLKERFEDIMVAEDVPRAQAAIQSLLDGEEELYSVEVRLGTLHAGVRWFLVRGACERDADGTPIRVAGSLLDIHDRKQAEHRSDTSERRYHELANRLPQFVWSARPDGTVDEVNDRFYEMTGVPHGLIGDELWVPAIHPEDIGSLRDRWVSSLATGETYEYTARIRIGTDYRWHLLQGRPERDADGRITRWFGTGTDIHDRQLAEEARVREQQRLESTVDGAALGIWEWDIRTGDIIVNERWAEILGHARSELEPVTAETWRRVCHPDDLEQADRELRRHLRGETDRYDIELRMQHREGRAIWVRTCGRVLERDASGRATRMFGLHEDVTERHLMAERLRASEERFRQLFESSGDAVLLLAGTRIIDANAAAAAMFDVADLDALRETSLSRWSPSRQPGGGRSTDLLADRLEEAVRDRSARFEWMHVRRDGASFWVETVLTRLPGSNTPVVHALLRDIGDRKRLEASLNRSITVAQAANRSKSEFLANMSHEIRTPMTAILGFVGLIERDLRTGDRTVVLPDAMATIRRNAEHLLALINDILDLSRIEAGRLEVERRATIPLAVIDEVVELMRVRSEAKGIALRVQIDPGVPHAILSDAGRLRQILVNLVGNAIKFTREGEVRIVVGPVTDDDGRPWLRIAVVDTGIGMLEDQAAHIFDAFTQADASTTRAYGGSGLGLRISASLAELLGGTIRVETELGEGSTFSLDLPAEIGGTGETGGTGGTTGVAGVAGGMGEAGDEPAPADRHASEAGDEPAGRERALNGVRILLAEDGPDIRELMLLILENSGAEVVVARDGQEAIDLAQSVAAEHRPFDVVLMDMQMPRLDGYAATRQLRLKGHRTPIIAVTADAMRGDRERCLAVGCDDHLPKPCSQAALIEAIRTQLGRANLG
jgi:PAS domain S-box-containing protein